MEIMGQLILEINTNKSQDMYSTYAIKYSLL